MLTLGPVLFQSFEIPEHINFGGRQALLTHKLPGGSRVVDAMGRDDDEIAWSGRFRSNSAARRARALDAMRIAGTPVTLAWGGFRYSVLVSEFKAEYRQAYEIPYTIACVVVTDLSNTLPLGLPGLSELLGVDLSAALGLSGDLSLGSITDAVADVQSAVAAAKSLAGSIPSNLSGIGDAVSYARGVLGQNLAAADSALALANTSTNSPAAFASNLSAQAGAMEQLSGLHELTGTLGRMAANVQSFAG